MRRYNIFNRHHCPHSNLEGIYGDRVNDAGGYRLVCKDCDSLIDGPVDLALKRWSEATPRDKGHK